jgi:hypothetical protein
MRGIALTLTLAALASAAFGQDVLSPDTGPGDPTCGRFLTLGSIEAQVQMLSTIQPLGDEIDPNDADAARQWAAEVTRACGDHADRPLEEAAREALGE